MIHRYKIDPKRAAQVREQGSVLMAPLIAGIVGGLAWAAGAEAWSWISPMRRRDQAQGEVEAEAEWIEVEGPEE
jgi:hypothetical protein